MSVISGEAQFAPIQREFCYEIYDTQSHPALGLSPREAEHRFLEATGKREHTLIPYDSTFEILTLPTTKTGVAKVHSQKGVHLNYLDYWCEALRNPRIAGQSVPVRYNPWDASIAYAYVGGKWEACVSSYSMVFKNRSQRAIEAATNELRQRNKNHAQERSNSGKKASTGLSISISQLAKFMEEVATREDMLVLQAQESASRASNESIVPRSTESQVEPAAMPALPSQPNQSSALPAPAASETRATSKRDSNDNDDSVFPTTEA